MTRRKTEYKQSMQKYKLKICTGFHRHRTIQLNCNFCTNFIVYQDHAMRGSNWAQLGGSHESSTWPMSRTHSILTDLG